MIKIVVLLTALTMSLFSECYGQSALKNNPPAQETMPRLGLKSNLLYDLTTTANLGVEVRMSEYLTLDISLNYNPWTFSNNRKFKHFMVQPELRYWVNEPFNGHFWGGHLLYSHFNVGNLPFGAFEDYRYQGDAYGFGVSYGYQWILSPRWSIEASLGIGYIHMDYTRYECEVCGRELGKDSHNYFGPTKAGISLIYILK